MFFLHTLIVFILWVSAVGWANEDQMLPEIDREKPKLNRIEQIAFTRRKPLSSLDSFRATVEGTGHRLGKKSKSKAWWNLYQFDIYTISPDGKDEKVLTNDGISRKPRWSFNKSKIAYVSGLDRSESLMVMNPDGSNKKKLLAPQYKIHDFWWAPNSLAILVAVESNRSKEPMENWVVNIKTGKKIQRRMHKWSKGWYHWKQKDDDNWEVKEPKNRLITSLPSGVDWPEWAPDQKHIAFTTNGLLALAEVEAVSATGKWYLQRTEPPCTKVVDWSPDGTKILFYVNQDICVATVDEGKITGLDNLSLMPVSHAAWCSDGSRISFVAGNQNHRRSREIFVMSVDTGQFRQITDTRFHHQDLDW